MKYETAVVGDRVRLRDGLVHLCNYVVMDRRAHYKCGIQSSPNIYAACDINKEPLTCFDCIADYWVTQ